ncbi:MAG TPA: glycoside hydrolase family 2 TIM barrel-domain containing protein [Candidatus Acidoferrum sp.]|nr:glycoside hydrolase family 2 TIM barrel-domain containing protein [Candidatus Acidoferrum sp.]
MHSRRKFLTQAGVLAVGTLGAPALPASGKTSDLPAQEIVSLCGQWSFRIDAGNIGKEQRWYGGDEPVEGWHQVRVPHTWQVDSAFSDHRGIAWYRRSFDAPNEWQNSAVRIEFEAVFHTATIWVNGKLAGEHLRKGYTAFVLDITHLLRWGNSNSIAVRVDNAFDEHMVPRGHSSDWAHDGGIYRPVQLFITPKTFVERVDVEAVPDLASGDGNIGITAFLRNASSKAWIGRTSFRIVDNETGLTVVTGPDTSALIIKSGETQIQRLEATIRKANLWHFDHPNLYRLIFSITDRQETHQITVTFGVRKLEAKDDGFYLNGERVRLMGVERMAGSNPEFGMAEPSQWITHDHDDLKHLNCVFTRVHWPQDKRVLDYCDRHGILMQSEIPAWGYDTFAGMGAEPDADILQNGLEQLREMITRDRNHPSIVVWGLCNEVGGQNPPAYQFTKRMLEEVKRLDPHRLGSYASNSLAKTPERDAAGLMDFIETNEYFGTWAPGTPEAVAKHLDDLHAAFPGKPVLISEYGYCACTEDRPEGDEHRIEILRSHDVAIRSKKFVAGAIFFCYNDYRTHVGDRGVGTLKQRVHGVVDIYGTEKASYEVLRQELSPVESLTVENRLNAFQLRLKTRHDLPMYSLRGYKLRGVFYGQGDIPVERREVELSGIRAGNETAVDLAFGQTDVALRVKFDVLRPTGFSAYTLNWKP